MHPHANKQVLWVDDDPSQLIVGQMVLERAGYSFLAARDGQEALRIVAEQQLDLILLDYTLGDMTGKEVFDLLVKPNGTAQRKCPPVIMLTGRNATPDERRALFARGLASYLIKPFSDHELLNVIENVMLTYEIRDARRLLEETNSSVLLALASLLSAKDNYTGEHSGAVLNFVAEVGRRLGLAEKAVYELKLAALLHDIGKIGVPEAILRKPSRLDDWEKKIMDEHVTRGYEALVKIPHLKRISEFVLRHHEWWDGRGYPGQLKGEQIPLESRIIAVVDAYDAMTSDRPYRIGMGMEIAIKRLREAAGTQFDPLVVDCFTNCLHEGTLGERNVNLPEL
ncbi:MAG TPA: HD domain-containing phosphohydrolase [Blastocatellia bacterium]|nr:HD domain-containing phosphohydrolase [Blastocatellia bacterium]